MKKSELKKEIRESILEKKSKTDDIDEMSTSGGAGAYNTPYAFKLKKKDTVEEITPAQQKYVDKAASKPSKTPKTQFRKDREGAKKMIDSGKNYSEEEIIKKYGEAAFNAVNADAEGLSEALTDNQREGLIELQGILDRAAQLGEEAREVVASLFPSELNSAEAYDIFNFGSSTNQYDNTLESLISDIEESADEDLDENQINEKVVSDNESPMLKAKIAAEDFMYQYRKTLRIVEGNHGKEAGEEFKKLVKDNFAQLQEIKEDFMKMGHLATNDDGVKKPIYLNYGYKLVDKSKS